ncbi:MAG: archease [Deltaproteobacteria bacterium]|nr:archease [Deltaproteobacteria bacterium]
MKKYEYFDHTADMGLRIYGPSLAGLFENAGCALFDVLTDTGRVKPLQRRRFRLQRDTVEELLVEWLGCLLYDFDARRILFSRFTVETIDGLSLAASAYGEKFQPGCHELKTAVKAVTYHGLSIRQEKGLWQATVVLDV